MATQTYPYIDPYHPVIANPKISTENWARNNLVNLRDFLITTGYMPFWDLVVSPGGGTDYTQPSTFTYTKGVEAIKIELTWGANKYPSKAYFYYSTDSKVTWQPLTDRLGKYVITFTYDSGENCTAQTWGTS